MGSSWQDRISKSQSFEENQLGYMRKAPVLLFMVTALQLLSECSSYNYQLASNLL